MSCDEDGIRMNRSHQWVRIVRVNTRTKQSVQKVTYRFWKCKYMIASSGDGVLIRCGVGWWSGLGEVQITGGQIAIHCDLLVGVAFVIHAHIVMILYDAGVWNGKWTTGYFCYCCRCLPVFCEIWRIIERYFAKSGMQKIMREKARNLLLKENRCLWVFLHTKLQVNWKQELHVKWKSWVLAGKNNQFQSAEYRMALHGRDEMSSWPFKDL